MFIVIKVRATGPLPEWAETRLRGSGAWPKGRAVGPGRGHFGRGAPNRQYAANLPGEQVHGQRPLR
jgi:hypothetical protein